MVGVGTVTENLSFEVDTWMNQDAEQGVNISGKVGGADLGELAFNNGPILLDGTTVSGTMEISWDPVYGASFSTTGLETNADFVNVPTGAFVGDSTFTFNISARVGGANQTLLIDNLYVTTEDPEAQLVNVTFNEDLTAASLFLEGLTRGQLYHVTGSVDGQNFFRFHESEFTADAPDLEVVQSVDVAFRRKLLLKVMEGPIPPE